MGSEYSTEKKVFPFFFDLNSEAFIGCVKVLSKEVRPQVKIRKLFFCDLDLSEFSLDFNDYYMKKYLFEHI